MSLSPRARAFIADLRRVDAALPPLSDPGSPMLAHIEELVASCSGWTIGRPAGRGDRPWEAELELHELEIPELLHFGWLIDRLLYGALHWDVPTRNDEPIRLRITGSSSVRSIPAYPPYELTVYDVAIPDMLIAVIHAHHFNELAKFVGACGSSGEIANAIRAGGDRATVGNVERFESGGFRFELMRSDTLSRVENDGQS